MANSTRMLRNPVTPSAQSPSTGARPSRSRPSSVKNSMAASMSSTTMPTLSMRLTVMMSPGRLTLSSGASHCRAASRPCRTTLLPSPHCDAVVLGAQACDPLEPASVQAFEPRGQRLNHCRETLARVIDFEEVPVVVGQLYDRVHVLRAQTLELASTDFVDL